MAGSIEELEKAIAAVTFVKLEMCYFIYGQKMHFIYRIIPRNTRNRDIIQELETFMNGGKIILYVTWSYMVDHEDNAWVTDVAMDQVIKFRPKRYITTIGYTSPDYQILLRISEKGRRSK